MRAGQMVWWAIIVGAILVLMGLGSLGSNVVGGLAIGLVGAALLAYGLTRPSVLVLRTASGDQDALFSRDQEMMNRVKGAIEAAVIQRG